jgi:GNAT superfamily N-acetyltransferase
MPIDSLKNKQEGIFNIEDARPEDVEALRAIVRDAWLELYPNETHGITREDISTIDFFKPFALEKRRKDIIENLDTAHTWVLRSEQNEVVGFCKAIKFNNFVEINGMYIIKELKGKGLGKKLIAKAFDWTGPDLDVRLKVVAYNVNAIEFYKKCGFKETPDKILLSDGTEIPNGKEIPRIEMVRKAK